MYLCVCDVLQWKTIALVVTHTITMLSPQTFILETSIQRYDSFLGIMNVGLSLRKTYRSQVFDRNFCVNVTLHMPCDSGLWLMLLLILLLKPVKTPQLKYTSPDGLQLICFLYSVNVNLVVLNVSSKHLGCCSNSQVRTVCWCQPLVS